jgi:hypothetical protein
MFPPLPSAFSLEEELRREGLGPRDSGCFSILLLLFPYDPEFSGGSSSCQEKDKNGDKRECPFLILFIFKSF